MAFTQDDINKIKAAIATGAKVVEYADKKVEYRSLAEMKGALDMMQSEVDGTQPSRVRFAQINSGHYRR